MNLDQDIRTMLRARADGVTATPTIPRSTVRRVRVRKTLMTGGVAVVIAALVFGGFAASRSLSNDAAPTPPSDVTEKKDPTVADFPALTTTFVSPRNGFSIEHPDRAALIPAKQLWDPTDGQTYDVVETDRAVFRGASTDIDPETIQAVYGGSIDEWVDEYVVRGGCGVPRSQQPEIRIDGEPGRISECPNKIEATVAAGGRLYLFTLQTEHPDARAVFDAFAATIDLTPETAVDIAALTKTFVSPTYGYSFGYFGILSPATEPWDPVNQPPISDRRLGASGAKFWDQFDVVETVLGAVFQSASTKIPDGVSIDEWVDASVAKYLPAGCYVPRSQQAEIAIDGQSGRISEDCGPVVATVVVDGRLYLFIALGDRGWFDAWVDTIHLTPETAAVP
jgi:hypothetical protein